MRSYSIVHRHSNFPPNSLSCKTWFYTQEYGDCFQTSEKIYGYQRCYYSPTVQSFIDLSSLLPYWVQTVPQKYCMIQLHLIQSLLNLLIVFNFPLFILRENSVCVYNNFWTSLSHCIICPDSPHFGEFFPNLVVLLYSYLLLLYLITIASLL